MPIIELELGRGCLGREEFKGKYDNSLKQYISRKVFKADVKDISKAYRKTRPCECVYTLIPVLVLIAGIILCFLRFFKSAEARKDVWSDTVMIISFLLMLLAVIGYVISLCMKRCSKSSGNRQFKATIKDINGERMYKQKDIHWKIKMVDDKVILMLLKGNPNNGTVKPESTKPDKSSNSIKKKESDLKDGDIVSNVVMDVQEM